MDDILHGRRRIGFGCFLIAALVFSCLGGFSIVLNQVCISALTWRVPVHPQAILVSTRHNLISSFGMGQTVASYVVPEQPETLRSWYNRQIGQKAVDASRPGEFSTYYRITQVQWSVSPTDDGVGSQVIIIAGCLSAAFN